LTVGGGPGSVAMPNVVDEHSRQQTIIISKPKIAELQNFTILFLRLGDGPCSFAATYEGCVLIHFVPAL